MPQASLATRCYDDVNTYGVEEEFGTTDDLDDSRTAPVAIQRPSAPMLPGARYELGELIGSGGMGEVIAARDNQIGRDVAIKRLHDDDPSPAALARFLREARIQGRLDHPAIPAVYDLDYDANGCPFFAMKKLNGTTLAEILRDPALRGRFSLQRLLRAFSDICLALELAHTRGVIHRDVKPSNVLLGDFGEVYILDWGVARMIDPASDAEVDPVLGKLTSVGFALGTPGYMAPETIVGEPNLDARVDVYALGCILFEILAGSQLHPRGDAGMQSALQPIDARPSTRADDIPPELDELCVRATTLDRNNRIGSARELGEAVQRYLDGDRDVSGRSQLARDHLATARDALAMWDNEERRRIAMREAGQALALDPTLIGAAELVGKLMLSPPTTTPRAVVAELEAIDHDAARYHAWVGVFVHGGYAVLALLLLAIGARDAFYIPALVSLAIASTILGVCETRQRRPTRTLTVAHIAVNIAMIALFARMFTPFLVAPGIGVVMLMTFAFHPAAAARRTLVATFVAGGVAILGVWMTEALGVISQTMQTHDGAILLKSPVTGIESVPIAGALWFYVITLFVVAAILSSTSARAQREARHHLHVQAWQLRQLISVPKLPVSPRSKVTTLFDPLAPTQSFPTRT